MGGRLLDARGRELEPVGASLDAIDRVAVAPGSVLERFREGPLGLRVAADVRSPLLGPRGAAGVFGPQKGATPDAVERLENGLERVASRLGCAEMAGMPGMGAAGGMAFGLSAVARASVEPGFAVFAGAARLGSLVSWADAVVTGEGVADGTSLEGKVVGGLIELVSGSGRPVAIVAGRSSEGVGWPAGVRVFAATADGGIAAAEQIASAACRAGRWLASG
jgi:glycerate kinase